MNKANLIRTIYLYIFSGVGLSLFLIGIFMGIQYLVNITQFEKYPLQAYEETQCDYLYPGKPMPIMERSSIAPSGVDMATPSAEEVKRQEEQCVERTEIARKKKQVDEVTRTLAFLIIGLPLFIFHWKMARKIG
jgi:hypothetical protein